jgi:hypothetical protein
MTDIQKIKEILKSNQPKCFEDFVCAYLNIYYDDFSVDRLFDLVERLNSIFMKGKIRQLDNVKSVAYERATYLKRYLDGKMYNDEQTAKANVEVQRNNAQFIIDVCKRAK